MTYTLTLENEIIAESDTLAGIWNKTLEICGHLTLAAFTERGYSIQTMEDNA